MKKMFKVLGLLMVLMLAVASLASAEDYKFGVRVRGTYVIPAESFDSRLSALNLQVSEDIVPAIDFEYFFTKNISTELMAAVTRHDIKSAGQFVGSTWLLPPTLSVKYHPLAGMPVSPYVGVGINATFPFKSKLNGVDDFSIDNTIGWVAQAGADIKIKENVYFNIDYKYVNVDTKIRVAGTKYKLDLNPNLVSFGLGYRF
ncbi:membrane protein [Geomonas silvestris]|uniref:Membrane protein n=1 Tax=Geomonas silvestris TaxID=2740184 RepID=A0A6V8MJF0_9BACT|nr:OmpW family outer membrane protein [Geomonas silvestris]GFO60145.1 membrane protein [Geomonas silvestris]